MDGPPPQTTLLVGGSNGTSTLCAILGDKSKPTNQNHTLRVATRSSTKYLNNDSSPRTWRCNEKKHISDVISADFLPTRTITHVGAPDSVFVYDDKHNDTTKTNDQQNDNGNISHGLSPLERAICGISAPDNGGIVDIIILACPVSAHLSLLRRIAKALYKLNAKNLLGSSKNRPPILIGTLYGAGGFDWMARIAFTSCRPLNFVRWNRSLGLFGLKAFPYLCKSLTPGEVSLHGRFPQLQVAVSPSTAYMRHHAGILLDRVLQNSTTGKTLEFLGLSGMEELGGDGTVGDESLVLKQQNNLGGGYYGTVETANSARNAMLLAAQTHKSLKEAKEGGSSSAGGVVTAASMPPPMTMTSTSSSFKGHQLGMMNSGIPPLPTLDVLLTHSLSDHADPFSSLGFLTCTLNSTNQILHPCILVALFGNGEDDGTITWNPKKELTPLPRFYADGAANPIAGQLITSIAGGEMYFVIDALERLLCPRGYDPITALHGGEPVGRKVMNWLGNSPHELGERSGLTGVALRREWQSLFGKTSNNSNADGENDDDDESNSGAVGNAPGLINRENLLSKFMCIGLSHNSRLNAVLSPCIIDESSKNSSDGTIRIKPNTKTRFFTDDTQHGLCIYLGLAELLGFDLERDMKTTLYVVRRLQHWMGKEFVLPENKANSTDKKIVSSARDVAETSAPQAFGIHSIQELRQFLKLDVFGEMHQVRAEDQLMMSGLVSRL